MNRRFRDACRSGRLARVREFVENHRDEININDFNTDAVVYCAEDGNFDIVEYLVDEFPNLDINARSGEIIGNILKYGEVGFLEQLTRLRPDINLDTFTVIGETVRGGDINALEWLSNKINLIPYSETLFGIAAYEGHTDILIALRQSDNDYRIDPDWVLTKAVEGMKMEVIEWHLATFGSKDGKPFMNNPDNTIKTLFGSAIFQSIRWLPEPDTNKVIRWAIKTFPEVDPQTYIPSIVEKLILAEKDNLDFISCLVNKKFSHLSFPDDDMIFLLDKAIKINRLDIMKQLGPRIRNGKQPYNLLEASLGKIIKKGNIIMFEWFIETFPNISTNEVLEYIYSEFCDTKFVIKNKKVMFYKLFELSGFDEELFANSDIFKENPDLKEIFNIRKNRKKSARF
jgi:hypothetical protein